MSLDLGVTNLATIVTNTGRRPVIVNGGKVKSINAYYNKRKAHLTGSLRIGKQPNEGQFTNKALERLHEKRSCQIKDFFHKASFQIVKMAIEEKVDTIVIGHNTGWKNEIGIGKRNNQNFCHIPHNLLINMITYKANAVGIRVVVQEESYTSKSSFLDNDPIPTYGDKSAKGVTFSGRRVKRGLYKSKEGILLNADVNGAANILHKFLKRKKCVGVNVFQPLKMCV